MAERLKIPGLAGELAAEFAGTLILILFGVGRRGPGGRRRHRRPRQHRLGLGPRRHPGRLRRRPDQRRPPQPRGDRRARRLQGLLLAQGAAVRAGADRRRVRGRAASCAGTTPRCWPSSTPGHTIKTQGVFSTLPGNGALPGAHLGRLRDQIIGTAILLFLILAVTDAAQLLARRQPRPVHHRPDRRGDRHGLGHRRRATRSTRPVTSARAWPRSSPATARRSAISTATCTSGSRSSARSIGGVLGAGLYQALIGRFLPSDERASPAGLPDRPEPRDRLSPHQTEQKGDTPWPTSSEPSTRAPPAPDS